MPTIQVARISDIPEAVEKTLVAINLGLWNAWKRGLDVQVPKEVSFQIDVIGEWQPESLKLVSSGVDSTEEIQGGETRDSSERQSRGSNIGNASKTGTGEQIHEEKNASTVTQESSE